MAVTAPSGVAAAPPATTARIETKTHNNPSEALRAPRSSRAAVAAWSCLLLSEEQHRRDGLRLSAETAGWEPIACGSIDQAAEEVERWRTQLAIVDLGVMPADQKAAYLRFANRLTSPDRLLLVCDEATGPESELHARQAGAWLYVPSPEFGEGMTELLGEAREVARKLAEPDSVTV